MNNILVQPRSKIASSRQAPCFFFIIYFYFRPRLPSWHPNKAGTGWLGRAPRKRQTSRQGQTCSRAAENHKNEVVPATSKGRSAPCRAWLADEKRKKNSTTPKWASHRLPYRSLERTTDRQPDLGRGSREICTKYLPFCPLLAASPTNDVCERRDR